VKAGTARKATIYYFPQITQITRIILRGWPGPCARLQGCRR